MKLEKLRLKLEENGLDGFLITNEVNRNYMTQFTGSTGIVLISKERAFFLTDFRYIEQGKKECTGFEVISRGSKEYNVIVAGLCKENKINKLGFEAKSISYDQYNHFKDGDGTENWNFPEFVVTENFIEAIRMYKTESELSTMKIAAEIADATFARIIQYIRPGITEIDVANEMEAILRSAGAKGSSFDMIVASGKRSSLPHGVASEKVIEKGDMVTLDFGASYEGYMSDMTRTIAVGDPGEKLKEVYSVVLQAQLAVCEQLKPGLNCREADKIARDIITNHGYGEYFGHSLGHGLGREVHEQPYLAYTYDTVILEPTYVVTNEPGIYLPNIGGVRIEDDLVITDTGNYSLTISPKELIVL